MTDQDKILEEARALETSTDSTETRTASRKDIVLTDEAELSGMREPIDAPKLNPALENRRTDTRSTLKSLILDNPGPALLIGAGLGWFFINREREKERALHHRVMDHGQSLKESTQESVADLKTSTSENLSAFQQRVGEKREQLADKGRSAGQYVMDTYRETRENNPLILGACALLGGLAIGLMLPPTTREDALMGEARNSLLDQAKRIVEDARDAAVSTLKASKESIAESVQDTGQEIADTAKEAFHEAREETKSNLSTSSEDQPIM